MQVRLIININHAESASIRKGTVPKNEVPEITMSSGFPVRALIAGIEVRTPMHNTKIKLTIALLLPLINGIKTAPAIVKIKDEITN